MQQDIKGVHQDALNERTGDAARDAERGLQFDQHAVLLCCEVRTARLAVSFRTAAAAAAATTAIGVFRRLEHRTGKRGSSSHAAMLLLLLLSSLACRAHLLASVIIQDQGGRLAEDAAMNET